MGSFITVYWFPLHTLAETKTEGSGWAELLSSIPKSLGRKWNDYSPLCSGLQQSEWLLQSTLGRLEASTCTREGLEWHSPGVSSYTVRCTYCTLREPWYWHALRRTKISWTSEIRPNMALGQPTFHAVSGTNLEHSRKLSFLSEPVVLVQIPGNVEIHSILLEELGFFFLRLLLFLQTAFLINILEHTAWFQAAILDLWAAAGLDNITVLPFASLTNPPLRFRSLHRLELSPPPPPACPPLALAQLLPGSNGTLGSHDMRASLALHIADHRCQLSTSW